MSLIKIVTLATFAMVLVGGCNDQEASMTVPGPVAMTEEAVGHYCSMNILEHTGPKAQIHLASLPHPVWFSQVRDGIAFTRSPEEHHEIVAVYVNDMERASNWDAPGDDTWIDAKQAWYVIGSSKVGGMGVPEVIPFGTEFGAARFVDEFGGTLVQLDGIPDSYVLGPAKLSQRSADPGAGVVQ